MKDQAFARARRQSLGDIFLVPAIIAVVSCAGLISALVGDNVWDWLSWLTLSVPVAVCVWYAFRRRRAAKP
jgi:membrane protein implicated in regulation of membrane protease activity